MKHIKKFEHYYWNKYDICVDCDCSPCQCNEMKESDSWECDCEECDCDNGRCKECDGNCKSVKESNSWECDCEECDCDNGRCKECDGNCKSVKESRRALLERRLSKKQKTLDKNFNGKIDAEDFEILRKKGKVSKHKCKSCGK